MNQRFAAVLLTAETLSISKAAEKCFVSYQCISGHICSLEEEYGVTLFRRRPVFSLTEDGRVLMEALQRIRHIEEGVQEAFQAQGKNLTGHVTLGVPMSRYTELVPPILARFKREYPNVELEIIDDYSSVLQRQVERGILDMAIVVQQAAEENEKIEKKILLKEQVLFLISNDLLQKCLGEELSIFRQRCKKRGITLEEIGRFPIVSYPAASRLRVIMDHYAERHQMHYQIVFTSNRTETFDAIARTGIAGCIISQQIYGITAQKNRHERVENRLQVFRINMGRYKFDSDIALIQNKHGILPFYKQRLVEIIGDEFAEYTRLTDKI